MPTPFTPRPSEIPRPSTKSEKEELQATLVEMLLNDKQSTLDCVMWLMYQSGYNYGSTYAYEIVKEANDTVL